MSNSDNDNSDKPAGNGSTPVVSPSPAPEPAAAAPAAASHQVVMDKELAAVAARRRRQRAPPINLAATQSLPSVPITEAADLGSVAQLSLQAHPSVPALDLASRGRGDNETSSTGTRTLTARSLLLSGRVSQRQPRWVGPPPPLRELFPDLPDTAYLPPDRFYIPSAAREAPLGHGAYGVVVQGELYPPGVSAPTSPTATPRPAAADASSAAPLNACRQSHDSLPGASASVSSAAAAAAAPIPIHHQRYGSSPAATRFYTSHSQGPHGGGGAAAAWRQGPLSARGGDTVGSARDLSSTWSGGGLAGAQFLAAQRSAAAANSTQSAAAADGASPAASPGATAIAASSLSSAGSPRWAEHRLSKSYNAGSSASLLHLGGTLQPGQRAPSPRPFSPLLSSTPREPSVGRGGCIPMAPVTSAGSPPVLTHSGLQLSTQESSSSLNPFMKTIAALSAGTAGNQQSDGDDEEDEEEEGRANSVSNTQLLSGGRKGGSDSSDLLDNDEEVSEDHAGQEQEGEESEFEHFAGPLPSAPFSEASDSTRKTYDDVDSEGDCLSGRGLFSGRHGSDARRRTNAYVATPPPQAAKPDAATGVCRDNNKINNQSSNTNHSSPRSNVSGEGGGGGSKSPNACSATRDDDVSVASLSTRSLSTSAAASPLCLASPATSPSASVSRDGRWNSTSSGGGFGFGVTGTVNNTGGGGLSYGNRSGAGESGTVAAGMGLAVELSSPDVSVTGGSATTHSLPRDSNSILSPFSPTPARRSVGGGGATAASHFSSSVLGGNRGADSPAAHDRGSGSDGGDNDNKIGGSGGSGRGGGRRRRVSAGAVVPNLLSNALGDDDDDIFGSSDGDDEEGEEVHKHCTREDDIDTVSDEEREEAAEEGTGERHGAHAAARDRHRVRSSLVDELAAADDQQRRRHSGNRLFNNNPPLHGSPNGLPPLPLLRSPLEEANPLTDTLVLGGGVGCGCGEDNDEEAAANAMVPFRPVAVKVLSKSELARPSFLESFRNELLMAVQLQHPCLVNIFGVAEQRDDVLFVMDLAEKGTVGEYLKRFGVADTREMAPRFLADVVLALEYLRDGTQHPFEAPPFAEEEERHDGTGDDHAEDGKRRKRSTQSGSGDGADNNNGNGSDDDSDNEGARERRELAALRAQMRAIPPEQRGVVLHRDLKPDNLLLTWDFHVKLGDFGSACFYGDVAANRFAGTPAYVSPEMIRENRAAPESDLWALGCVLYELLEGVPAFRGETPFFITQKIKNFQAGDVDFPSDGDKAATAEGDTDGAAAPALDPHAVDLVKQLLQPDPRRRLGSDATGGFEALKSHPFFRDIEWECVLDTTNITPTNTNYTAELEGFLEPGESVCFCSPVFRIYQHHGRRRSTPPPGTENGNNNKSSDERREEEEGAEEPAYGRNGSMMEEVEEGGGDYYFYNNNNGDDDDDGTIPLVLALTDAPRFILINAETRAVERTIAMNRRVRLVVERIGVFRIVVPVAAGGSSDATTHPTAAAAVGKEEKGGEEEPKPQPRKRKVYRFYDVNRRADLWGTQVNALIAKLRAASPSVSQSTQEFDIHTRGSVARQRSELAHEDGGTEDDDNDRCEGAQDSAELRDRRMGTEDRDDDDYRKGGDNNHYSRASTFVDESEEEEDYEDEEEDTSSSPSPLAATTNSLPQEAVGSAGGVPAFRIPLNQLSGAPSLDRANFAATISGGGGGGGGGTFLDHIRNTPRSARASAGATPIAAMNSSGRAGSFTPLARANSSFAGGRHARSNSYAAGGVSFAPPLLSSARGAAAEARRPSQIHVTVASTSAHNPTPHSGGARPAPLGNNNSSYNGEGSSNNSSGNSGWCGPADDAGGARVRRAQSLSVIGSHYPSPSPYLGGGGSGNGSFGRGQEEREVPEAGHRFGLSPHEHHQRSLHHQPFSQQQPQQQQRHADPSDGDAAAAPSPWDVLKGKLGRQARAPSVVFVASPPPEEEESSEGREKKEEETTT